MYFVNCGRTSTRILFIINTRRALNLCAFVITAIRSTATLRMESVATRSSPETIWDLRCNGMIVTATGAAGAIFNEFRPDISRKYSHKDLTHRTRCATKCRSAMQSKWLKATPRSWKSLNRANPTIICVIYDLASLSQPWVIVIPHFRVGNSSRLCFQWRLYLSRLHLIRRGNGSLWRFRITAC